MHPDAPSPIRNIKRLTPAEAAAWEFRIHGLKADPDTLAERLRSDAAEWRKTAAKAAASKTGKFNHCTEAFALWLAGDLEERANTIPAELRKLIAAAS